MPEAAQESSDTLRRAAQNALQRRAWDEAEAALAQLLAKNPNDHAALAMLAGLRLQQSRAPEAFHLTMRLVNAAPDCRAYKDKFLELARAGFSADDVEALGAAIAHCLKEPDLAIQLENWAGLLLAQPGFDAAYRLKGRRSFDPANKAFFEGLTDFRPLLTPLFMEGIKSHVVCDPVFEDFIAAVRWNLLSESTERRRLAQSDHVRLAAALSHYAFATDFILDTTQDEDELVAALAEGIETDAKAAEDESAVAVLACYRPLHSLKNAQALLDTFRDSAALSALVKAQIADPLRLAADAAAIPAITGIAAGLSSQVREQYESFPYPRWKYLSKDQLVRDWQADACFQKTEGLLRGTGAKILVAGCGTGKETATLAAVLPDADITAIDLSRASLGYAALRAQELGLQNIAFRHADILKLGELGTRFDYIAASGVLHHMADPLEGWRMLLSLLKPGGLMRVGLYSELGRRAVAAARAAIARGSYPPTREGMLRFRRDAPRLLDPTTLASLASLRDYYNLSMYRDLLFHVQEHRFDLPQIERALQQLDLSFEGFHLTPDLLARYHASFPGDPSALDLPNWDSFERKYPDSFASTYSFWVRPCR